MTKERIVLIVDNDTWSKFNVEMPGVTVESRETLPDPIVQTFTVTVTHDDCLGGAPNVTRHTIGHKGLRIGLERRWQTGCKFAVVEVTE